MDLFYLLQQILNGLCQGSIYALMAIGYTMIYGVVGLVSFNYGETVMIGAFGSYYAFLATGNFFVGILFGAICSAVLGIFVYKLCYERFLDSPPHISMVCTIGFSMLAKNLAQIAFGSDVKPLPEVFKIQSYTFWGFRISNLQLVIMGCVVLSTALFTIFLNYSRTGTKLRAVSQDRRAAALVGINVRQTTLMGNCIGCALGGIAGVMLGLYYTTVVPTMGSTIGLKALISTILGGLSSISGAALSGLTLGVLENVGIAFIDTGLRDAVAFVFLVLVLVFKPQGLFAKKGGRRDK
ncbi:MAG: branched-chain amino acid ABC transporter permease [Hydrogenoanaerobacterium sp.]